MGAIHGNARPDGPEWNRRPEVVQRHRCPAVEPGKLRRLVHRHCGRASLWTKDFRLVGHSNPTGIRPPGADGPVWRNRPDGDRADWPNRDRCDRRDGQNGRHRPDRDRRHWPIGWPDRGHGPNWNRRHRAFWPHGRDWADRRRGDWSKRADGANRGGGHWSDGRRADRANGGQRHWPDRAGINDHRPDRTFWRADWTGQHGDGPDGAFWWSDRANGCRGPICQFRGYVFVNDCLYGFRYDVLFFDGHLQRSNQKCPVSDASHNRHELLGHQQ
jgi:hypothetical protein